MREHAPAGPFLGLRAGVHAKAGGGGGTRAQTRIMQPSGGAAQMEAVVKTCSARIVSKELQVLLKVRMSSFQASKWIQSLEHEGGGGWGGVSGSVWRGARVLLFHFEWC